MIIAAIAHRTRRAQAFVALAACSGFVFASPVPQLRFSALSPWPLVTHDFNPENTPAGELPPWEVAKAYAFSVVIEKMREVTGMSVGSLLGTTKAKFIAGQVRNANGQHPGERAVQHVASRCQKPDWFLGKPREQGAGRKPVYSDYRKEKVASVAMESLKRKLVAPSPRRARQRLPGLTRNIVTGKPMDDKTLHTIFNTRCYDEREDDPWQHLDSPSQDVIAEALQPLRAKCARWILNNIPQNHWNKHIGIDPCCKLLPKNRNDSKSCRWRRWARRNGCHRGLPEIDPTCAHRRQRRRRRIRK